MASDGRPAQPKTILRGHKVQVHAAVFCRQNERLFTGDADGFVVAWDLTIMRARAVWQAHTNAILGIAGWGDERIITHGRDNKLAVWKLRPEDEASMSTVLPLDPSPKARPLPWMLHMLEVNTMNFCSFASCPADGYVGREPSEMLIAVPNTLASEAIDIFHLPSQDRRHTIKLGEKNGMVMALSLLYKDELLTLVAAYEDGLATVAQLASQGWTVRYQAKVHSQPILSLGVSPSVDFFYTSSADAIIAKHPLPTASSPSAAAPSAGEVSDTHPSEHGGKGGTLESKGGISAPSAALAAQSLSSKSEKACKNMVQTEPLKVVNTRHAGQQSLRIRSDQRIFATAGWDSKIRVYSNKTMKEIAVLKWHQVGCYAAAFAETEALDVSEIIPPKADNRPDETPGEKFAPAEAQLDQDSHLSAVPKLVDMTLKEKRSRQARTTHWLAAGSKDGKVSLWDIF